MNRKYLFMFPLITSLIISACGGGEVSSSESSSDSSTNPSSSLSSSSSSSEVSYITPPSYQEDSVSIHLYRADGKYDSWALWLWNADGGDGKEFAFNGLDEYGAIAAYPLSQFGNVEKLGFIVKGKGNWTKDIDADRFIDFSEFVKDSNGIYHIYLKSKDKLLYCDAFGGLSESVYTSEFSGTSSVNVVCSQNISKIELLENGSVIASKENVGNKNITLSLPVGKVADLNNSYNIKVTFESGKAMNKDVSIASLYKTEEFDQAFTYTGDDLGATYTKTKTTFKVWSPISSSIKVRIYNSGIPKSVYSGKGDDSIYKEVNMEKGDKGVFEATINEDLAGKYYTYIVTNSKFVDKEIVDPYAKSAGINGLRGMVVDFESSEAKPVGWDEITAHPYDRKELTVYETHVADVTSSSTWGGSSENKKKFLGMCESGTTYTEGEITVKTGFDHIKELGVNAVQLVPIFDQDNNEKQVSFNWGYNPLNYNCLEGGYSSDATNGYSRIKEFKTLVKAYNEAGINIIMDVVYNHVSGASSSNFDVLMPNYYFRYTSDGALSNGSGCGNETASELPMMRKFIKDSICFYTKEYKLGGFRFDLMGLHDIDTMNYVVEEAKKINPNIVIYGEPWTGGTSTLEASLSAKQDNGNKYVGYGQFNDQFRDSLIKGGLNSSGSKGFITNNTSAITSGDMDKLVAGIKGITKSGSVTINDPDKTVNYVTCHDNYTLYDRIKAAGISGEDTIAKMAMPANSMVFSSQGTTFMLAGEEMLRSKGGDSNSYQSSYKVNELDYSLKIKNMNIFKNYQKLISLKQSFDGLHLGNGANLSIDVKVNSDNNMVSYQIKGASQTYIFIHVNGLVKNNLSIDLSDYTLYLDTVNENKQLSANTSLEQYETIIAYKNN